MWLWGEQWEEKEKKKKSRPFHAGPRSFTDARHSSIGFPLESSGPSSGTRDEWQPQSGNRANFRPVRSDSVLLRSTLNFASFLPFFFFFCQSKKREEREERETSRSVLSSDSFVKSWHRLFPRYFVHIFARESRRNGSSGDAWNPASPFLPLSLPLPLSRGIYEREKVSRSCNVSRASSMESRFLKGSGMGETREIFNRNRLDP